MDFPDSQILVFAKAPIAGNCKTRLGRRIGMQAAASVQQQLLRRTLSTASSAKLAPVAVYCDPHTRHPLFPQLRREFAVSLFRQSSGDLGARMHAAFSRALQTQAQVLLIGTDCPQLDAGHLQRSLQELRAGQDAVFIPCDDGGYALVGLRRPAAALFRNIRWGSPRVMAQTRQRLQRSGLCWSELEPLWDVDELPDYRRARRKGLIDSLR